jgi:hypothetical protein
MFAARPFRAERQGKNREISDWTNGLGEKFIFLQPIELPYNEIQRI